MDTERSIPFMLEKVGLRLTPQRLAICRYLQDNNEHPTATAIYEELRDDYPSLSLMTVYNTLNTLVDVGAVNALGPAGDGAVHYDGNVAPHVNLACVACHKIIDIMSPLLEDLQGIVRKASGYKILGTRMMYYGICPDCQKTTNRSNMKDRVENQ